MPAPTVSQALAEEAGVTTQQVHFELGVPQLSFPVLGMAVHRALRGDLVTAFSNKDVRTLSAARDIIEATPQIAPVGKRFAKNLDKIAKDFITRLEE